jgi:quercetin dioxygenase-like cupin family protein
MVLPAAMRLPAAIGPRQQAPAGYSADESRRNPLMHTAVDLSASALDLASVPVREQMPGMRGRFLHSAAMTFVYWDIDEGAALPRHAHHHEQVVNMLEGEFELVVDGTPHRLKPGDVLAIPGNAPHSGRAITRCRILDVFWPIREDYRFA